MGTMIEYPRNGRNVSAYLATPSGAGPFPAVIVIQEWWGLNAHIRDVAERSAREGYVSLAPDLYHGKVTDDPNEAGKLMGALNRDEAIKDLIAGIHYLQGQKTVRGNRIGVAGFCMGGSFALLLPCKTTEIRAAVPYYGEIPDEAALQSLACPVLYVYGEADFWITRKDVRRLENALN